MGERFRDKYDERTAKGFATEEDRVNCPFYFKIGSCRNGDRCNRIHQRPDKSQYMWVPHMYPASSETLAVSNDEDWDDETYWVAQEHTEAFYEEVWMEMAKFGEVEDMVVMDNTSDHMIGSIMVKYVNEDDAEKACRGLQNRFYGGRLLQPELSPIADFREAQCRSFHENRCSRGGLCNFMHIKHAPRAFKRRVIRKMYDAHPEYKGPNRFRSERLNENRSRSPSKAADGEKPKEERPKRQTSEERRAMIAEWNREALREAAQQSKPNTLLGNMVRPPGFAAPNMMAGVRPLGSMIVPPPKMPMTVGLQPS